MTKKYELIPEERGLFRIVALRDIPISGVKKGDIGGRVASEHNLSQEGDCWIGRNAFAVGESCVRDDAQIMDSALVTDNAVISGSAVVCNAAIVSGCGRVRDMACISGHAEVGGQSQVFDHAIIRGFASLNDYAIVYDDSIIEDHAWVRGTARVSESGHIGNHAWVGSDSRVSGKVCLTACETIGLRADLRDQSDVQYFAPPELEGERLTWTRSNKMWYSTYRGYCTTEKLLDNRNSQERQALLRVLEARHI